MEEIQSLRAQVAALDQLLEVFENAVLEQSDKLYAEIAERTRAEARLGESEEKFRAIFDKASDGILLADAESKQFLMGNEAISRMLGYDQDELRQLRVRDIHPQEELPSTLEAFGRMATGEIDRTADRSVLRRDGSVFLADIHTAVIMIGTRIYLLGAFRDVTGRRQTEDRIRGLNEELKSKVKELLEAQAELVRKEKLAILGLLSASVGHELRNPLAVMSNAVYFLEMVLPGADETVKEYLGIIKSEIDSSQRVISDLLDFSRTRTPRADRVSVEELIERSLRNCTVPKGVSLRVEISGPLPALTVDPLQVAQVIQNLVVNAVQAMPSGGDLSVRVRWRRDEGEPVAPAKDASDPPSGVEISVADTGEGITPENMRRLFQPLFTTKSRGIGLGLVVVKNLTEANGGRIEVKSEPGKGTTFTVLLPIEGPGPPGPKS
ncbi:MAG: PAS domain S-box protein [Deltaproteobacteria bacterium]|nr:PAS domain S-box protein [Deltaproteobacteria bacterium]